VVAVGTERRAPAHGSRVSSRFRQHPGRSLCFLDAFLLLVDAIPLLALLPLSGFFLLAVPFGQDTATLDSERAFSKVRMKRIITQQQQIYTATEKNAVCKATDNRKTLNL